MNNIYITPYKRSRTRKNKSYIHNQIESTNVYPMDLIPDIIRQSLQIYPDGIFDPPITSDILESDRILVRTKHMVIRRVKYVHNTYSTYGVFKPAHSDISDNLFYEYMVGTCCVNTLSKKFPIFVHTYGLYTMVGDILKQMRRNQCIDGTTLQNHLAPFPIDQYEEACKKYKQLGLCVQYCPDIIMLSNTRSITHYKTELGIILFQIYFALSQCRHVFTHYDLHDDNVGVIPLPKNTCIKYVYDFTDNQGRHQQVTFVSKYIVKILDYGKSYFSGISPDGKIITSASLIRELKRIHSCKPTEQYGLNLIFPKYYINPSIVNNSHDLRLLYILSQTLDKIPELSDLSKYLIYNHYYGTPHINSSNYYQMTRYNLIQNVTDASNVLFNMITRVNHSTGTSIANASIIQYSECICIGTIQVGGLYTNMRFIPTSM